ncbi:phosphatase PAP2 family protein [Lucifera butyrica]|uniref:phosphatase PAP2 family protein n=1 Tax=Lucifera butyrica TaxID=1351585 RepID=UPI001A9D12F0|nr:phosphatase PAP2 family protein [Lucifera butyrica]
MGRIWKSVVLGCLVLAGSLAIVHSSGVAEYPDVFSHKDISIEPNQVIERLLVAGANATVSGTVKDGIVLIDGNLRLMREARIQGSIVVLGGHVMRQTGSQVDGYVIHVPPQGFPLLKIVIGWLFLIAGLSLILLPLVLWLLFSLSKRFSVYEKAKKWLFTVQDRWPILYIALTLGLSCSMLLLFSILAWETMFRHAMGVFDNTFIWLVRYFANPTLDHIMIAISTLGYGFSYAVIVTTSFVALAVYRRWLELGGLALSFAGGAVLNFVLKNLFERTRPDAFHLVTAAGYSFPSGHAMVSLCFYGMLAFLLARNAQTWPWRYFVGVITMLLVVAIGISRIYLGVHYPSDVVAGYSAGTMWLLFVISLLMWWEHEREEKMEK